MRVKTDEHDFWVLADRWAVSRDKVPHLHVLSAAGKLAQVDAIQDAMEAKHKASKFVLRGGSIREWLGLRDTLGYEFKRRKLGPGIWQLLAIAKRPGLLLNASDDGVWRHITSTPFDTPLIPSWKAKLVRRLREYSLVKECDCFGCEVATCSVMPGSLDTMVSFMLKDKDLVI